MWNLLLTIFLIIGSVVMPHDLPDFGMYAPKSTVAPLVDMAELAVRLGSICTFDRRGDVIFIDDFEIESNAWQGGGDAGDSYARQSSNYCRSGQCSYRLYGGTGVGMYCQLQRKIPIPVLSKLGSEVSFMFSANSEYIYFGIILYNGTNRLQGIVRYYPSEAKLKLYDSTATWQEIATNLNLQSGSYLFHTIKIVVDANSEEFVRLILDSTEYDISAYSLHKSADATHPYIQFYYGHVQNANYLDLYVDDAIVTQNEP